MNFIITATEHVTTVFGMEMFLKRVRDAGAEDNAEVTDNEGAYIKPEVTWKEK